VRDLEALAGTFATRWQQIVTPRPTPVGNRKGRVRPLKPGYSVGYAGGRVGDPNGAGTIGGFIRAKSGIYLLSNAHVLTANPFAPNDTSPVSQPGPGDGGAEVVADVAAHGRLLRGSPNVMDAAIARLRGGVQCRADYEGVGELTGMRYPRRGETLTLVGRTTRVIRAVVQDVNANATVADWTGVSATLSFIGVTVLQASHGMFTNLAGDSGGMWIGQDNKAVALNFGGGEESETGLAIPIPTIVAYFQFRLNDPKAGLIGIDNSTLWR
jgi:hypothetical protein